MCGAVCVCMCWHVVINLLATVNLATFQNCFASFLSLGNLGTDFFACLQPSMKNELNFKLIVCKLTESQVKTANFTFLIS